MNLKTLLDFLKSFGLNLNVTEESSGFVLFCLTVLVLSLVSLFCVLNIIF